MNGRSLDPRAWEFIPMGILKGTSIVMIIKIPRKPMMKLGPYRYSFGITKVLPTTKGMSAKIIATRYTHDVASNSHLLRERSGAHCSWWTNSLHTRAIRIHTSPMPNDAIADPRISLSNCGLSIGQGCWPENRSRHSASQVDLWLSYHA